MQTVSVLPSRRFARNRNARNVRSSICDSMKKHLGRLRSRRVPIERNRASMGRYPNIFHVLMLAEDDYTTIRKAYRPIISEDQALASRRSHLDCNVYKQD